MTAKHFALLTALAVPALVQTAHAQIPQMIAYQGRVAAGGVNFHGTGQFKFAIVRGNYAGNPGEPLNLWSNDGSLPATDTTSAPTAAVSMTCDRGLYSVLLGNTAAGMVAIPPAVFTSNGDVRLRVWFNDGTHGWQKLTPDQRLVSVGYAMMAESAASAQTVADNAITTAKLANGSVTSAKLAAGSVGSGQLADNSITNGKIADGSLITADLADGTITNAKLSGNSVTGASILDSTITTADIFDGTIGTADLANGAVTAAKVAGNTITAAEIAPAAVATSELADGSVTNAKLTAGAVATQQIQTGAVRSLEILDGSVAGADLATDTLTATHIAPAAITSSELADGAVTTPKIGPSAVASAQIANASILNADLAFNVINTGEIIDGAVQTQDLANGAVTPPKLAIVPAARLKSPAKLNPAVFDWNWHVLTWQEEQLDTAALHSPATQPTRLVAPVDGLYLVHAHVSAVVPDGAYDRGSLWLGFRVNQSGDAPVSNAEAQLYDFTAGREGHRFFSLTPYDAAYTQLTCLIPLNAGEHVEVTAKGTALNAGGGADGLLTLKSGSFTMHFVSRK